MTSSLAPTHQPPVRRVRPSPLGRLVTRSTFAATVALLGLTFSAAIPDFTQPYEGGVTAMQAAQAQSVYTAILVNDVPISNFDISARAALLRLQGASRGDAAQEAENVLIDEALQRAEARRLGVTVSQAELDQAMETIAARSNLSVSQLGQALRANGVDLSSLRDSIEAQILWDQIIRARFRATVRVDEQDVLAALDSRDSEGEEGQQLTSTEYTIREIIFVVPEGAGSNVTNQRQSEATAFRSRFDSCSAGVSAARQLSGVIVQSETRRFSSDLTPGLNDLLQETPVGRLTAPEVTDEGILMLAVCNKREVRSDADARRDVESELRNEEGVLLSRGYLRDLRASATIVRPNN